MKNFRAAAFCSSGRWGLAPELTDAFFALPAGGVSVSFVIVVLPLQLVCVVGLRLLQAQSGRANSGVGPRTRTMMQSCASAAKLRGGGPILHFGIEAKETRRDPATSNRHRRPVTSGRTRPKLLDTFGDFRS